MLRSSSADVSARFAWMFSLGLSTWAKSTSHLGFTFSRRLWDFRTMSDVKWLQTWAQGFLPQRITLGIKPPLSGFILSSLSVKNQFSQRLTEECTPGWMLVYPRLQPPPPLPVVQTQNTITQNWTLTIRYLILHGYYRFRFWSTSYSRNIPHIYHIYFFRKWSVLLKFCANTLAWHFPFS